MNLIHLFEGSPRLWIAQSTAGHWYLFRELSVPGTRARLRINEAYARALIEMNSRDRAELALSQAYIA